MDVSLQVVRNDPQYQCVAFYSSRLGESNFTPLER
jgi:hypothetical protein